MKDLIIRNASVANEGREFRADLLLRGGVIDRIAEEGIGAAMGVEEINAQGMLLIPGVIDDQVHFR
ncbi:MAG TPA: dihydroorotase, partial [Flavobacteriales bacterium]|nr:dihydroorotase [Flavobacteriales bacterium]